MIICENCGISIGLEHKKEYDCDDMTHVNLAFGITRSRWTLQGPKNPYFVSSEGWRKVKLRVPSKEMNLAA